MATLQVGAADLPATKKKALEDAEKMQRTIIRDCAENGRDIPPYALSELIGKGSFGRVYKAKASATGQLVAVKIISIDEGDSIAPGASDTFNDILKEVNTLKKLGNSGAKNINTVIETLLVGPSMWIVTEYCGGGSVSTLMRPSGGLPEKWIIPILREVAEALYWVHNEGIIHRDIKCANVLVTETGGVQLCDFGVAGIIETKFDKRSTVTGTLNWMAPELFDMSVSYGTEVDIWAFGSLAFEAATGLPPNAKNMARIDIPQFGSYLKQHCPRLEGDQYSDHLRDLVAFCMTENPRDRPSITQIQRHPYISNTAKDYPTHSLSMLVKAYRLWEVQGGNRMSLFNAGGAQAPTGNDDPEMLGDDGWNFETMTGGFDAPLLGEKEAKAVYDAYGPRVSMMPPPPKDSSRRRRPPPNVPALKGPLEKAFDPNTITNYEDNSRLFYGRPMPTSAPEMGAEMSERSNPEQPRESLIDLDMSLDGDRLSRFADMEGDTIKGSDLPKRDTIRESGLIDLDESLDGDRLSRFVDTDMSTIRASRASIRPLGRSQSTMDHRRTQEWTFPATIGEDASEVGPLEPHENGGQRESQLYRSQSTMDHRRTQDWTFASAASQTSPKRQLDIARSQSSLENRRTQEWTFASAASANAHLGGEWFHEHEEDDYMALDALPRSTDTNHQDDSLAVTLPPRAATSLEVSRFSSSSLIDLDASLTDEGGELLRPSTAVPDSAASDSWMPPFRLQQNSFGLSSDSSLPSSSREPSLYIPVDAIPRSNREPSLYIPDDAIPRSNREPSLYIPDDAITRSDREPSLFITGDVIPRGNREPSLYVSDTISPNGSFTASEREPFSYAADDLGPGPSTPTSEGMVMTPPSDLNDNSDEGSMRMNGNHVFITVESDVDSDTPMPSLPYMPRPPTVNVLQGIGPQEDVKDELQRMIRSLHEHLQYTSTMLRTLPTRSTQTDHTPPEIVL